LSPKTNMEQESSQLLPVNIERLLKLGSPLSKLVLSQRKTIILEPPKDLPASPVKRSAGMTSTESLIQPNSTGKGFSLYASRHQSELSAPSERSSTMQSIRMFEDSKGVLNRSKKISKKKVESPVEKKSNKKVYEISRFFVKNYVGALKSTIYNPNCEQDIIQFLGCSKDHILKMRQELEKLLIENPKHNRMQMFKVLTNPLLNHAFQYFLRRKVVSWIFTSSKMQDRQAHLMARKNFLHLCLKAKDLTPFNFRIALN